MGLNDWFTQHYRLTRHRIERELQRGSPPLFVRLGDDLILFSDERRRSASVRDERYHRLKEEAHLPVSLHLWLRRHLDTEGLGSDPLDALRDEVAQVAEGQPEDSVVGETLSWLDEVLAAGHLDAATLVALEERTRAGILRHIEEAALIEMRLMHEIVGHWTQGWSAEAWSRVRVLVCAGRQPRYRQSARQYFERLLRVQPEEKAGARQGRVLYAENVRSEEEALQHVATHLLDRELGEAFVNSPLALQQDLLADAAERALDALGLPRVGAEGEDR